MYYVKVSMRLIWGFTVKNLISSKTRESYIIPPPTTLIGALAYGYTKLKGIPEEEAGLSSAERVRKLILSVHERMVAPVTHYADLSRIWWYGRGAVEFDAVAIGKVYKGVSRGKGDFEAIYVIGDSDKARDIALAAHSIIRIGGSYGLVSVEDVEVGPLSCSKTDNMISTRYSFWEDLINGNLPEDILVQEVVDYRKNPIGNYASSNLRRRVYPYSKTLMKPVEVSVGIDPSKAVACKAGEEVLVVEVP